MKYLFAFVLSLSLFLTASYSAQAQSAKPKARINHTAVFVVDLKVTRAFYENIVGLDSIPEPFHDGKHKWYSLGQGVAMHVIQGATEKKTYYKNQHTCFSVASVDDFAAVLKKNNIAYEDVKGNKNAISLRVDGIKQIWLQDPDGYWIEINDAKE
jgi:lactoylglutathione lyase